MESLGGGFEVEQRAQRIRIDRESEASHDLIPSLDEPAGTDGTLYKQISFLECEVA